MFAYVVKRLLSGVVVLFLISMSVFLLFWYGPSEPAQTICDNDTSNRCTPARLEVFRENLGFNNPWYEEYGKFMKGVVAGREIQFGSTTVFECPAPCLGYSYRTKAPVFEEMKERMPGHVLGGHRRRVPLPDPRHPHRRRRGPKTRDSGRQGARVELPGRLARSPTTCSPC